LRLFGKTHLHALESAWKYDVKGVIWRIHPTSQGVLMGEERRIDQKKALFFCLDCQNGRELWQQPSPGDAWWIGIETVCRDTVFFHGFATPNLPLHRGVIALDVLTGNKLWEDKELEFVGSADDFVVGSQETSAGRSLVVLDRRSGTRRNDQEASDLLAQRLNREEAEGEIKFPVPLNQLDDQVVAAIRGSSGTDALAGPVEIVEDKGLIVFDHNEVSTAGAPRSPLFSSMIAVVERATGALLYRDTVCSVAAAVIPELFFVQHDVLYYIKERQTLIAVRLVP
jgi:hypothetical protein